MNNKTINTVSSIVESACKSKNNKFGKEIWKNHILPVLKYVDALAIICGADREICALAALLHDYAGIYDYKYYKDHHIHSAELAQVLLRKLKYPEEKIALIKDAIYTHRGSMSMAYHSLEAECLANADALAHMGKYDSLINYAHDYKYLSWHKSRQFALEKVERSWSKMTDSVKCLFEDYYLHIMQQLKLVS